MPMKELEQEQVPQRLKQQPKSAEVGSSNFQSDNPLTEGEYCAKK
jgi:hypothetical protein